MELHPDVLVVGGGNAGLCAALAASDRGCRVMVVERAPRQMRGGNSRHTRNIRDAHLDGDGYVTGPYGEDEFLADLASVTGTDTDRPLTKQLVEESASLPAWMRAHGAAWQAPLRGTLHLSRTNRFFLGGGKALVNAYYQAADDRGIGVEYDAEVTSLELDGRRCAGVIVRRGAETLRIAPSVLVAAAGGFEASIEWHRRYAGDAADNYVIRGSPYNDGTMLRMLFDAGAASVADPTAFHAIAVDARSPRFDGGIVTRLDAIPFGIAVNREAERFYDEGEDLWPKRYAIWGGLIASQPDQIAYSIFDERARPLFMPSVFPALSAPTVPELAVRIGLDPGRLSATVAGFNAAVRPGARFDPLMCDGAATNGLVPPKSNWARPIDSPPFHAYPMRPGITFTYHGVRVDRRGHVLDEAGSSFENILAAGEIMAGNILTRGYLAGIGMTIGSVYGRLAGEEAASLALA